MAVVLQTTATGIVCLRFEFNRQYIAQNLCVKKEEKNNCCQGSCHLKKELDQTEKKDKGPAAPHFELQNLPTLFCQQQNRIDLSPALFTRELVWTYRFSQKTFKGLSAFHPPTF